MFAVNDDANDLVSDVVNNKPFTSKQLPPPLHNLDPFLSSLVLFSPKKPPNVWSGNLLVNAVFVRKSRGTREPA